MDPLVSISMPTYNNAEFIIEAIESCLGQTYTNIEICISDDKSTDETAEIVKRFVRDYPGKIKFEQLPRNMGIDSIAFNVNNAFKMCAGKYIAVLEGDDAMLPSRIEEQVAILEKDDSLIATHHDIIIYGQEQKAEIKKNWKCIDHNVNTRDLIIRPNFIHTPTIMFKNIGLQVDVSIKRMLDWYMYIILSLEGNFHYLDKKLTKYRIHENNITKRGFAEDIYIILSLIEIKYPELIRYINIRRTMNYMSKLRQKDLRYISPVLSMGFYNIASAIYFKNRNSRKLFAIDK